MQVCYLTKDLFRTGSVSEPIGGGQADNYQNCNDSRRHHPGNAERGAARFCFNSTQYPFPELRTRSKSFSDSLNASFHLDACKGIGPAGRTAVHMAIEVVHLFRRELPVKVSIESGLPKLTNHSSFRFSLESAPLAILHPSVAAVRLVAFFWHVRDATSPYRSELTAFPQSPDMTSPPPHTEAKPHGNAQVTH